MKKTLVKTRKFNKETYNIYLYTPSYEGEVGCLGIKQTPYIEVETPENDFGYSDKVLFNEDGKGCTMYRYLQPWIIKKLEKINHDILASLD